MRYRGTGDSLTADQNATLDDLLQRWHRWADAYRPRTGWNTRSAGVGQFRVSRQYDDANGALDDDIEASVMETVEYQVSQMEGAHQTALHCQARALSLGCMVFVHPRLPADMAERKALISEARTKLVIRLTGAGVMG